MSKLLFKLNNTEHFSGGAYRKQEENIGINGSIYEYHDIISVQFNQLKGKLFNLIEASAINRDQGDAMKGLVKGFCNYQYNNIIGDLENWIKNMGFEIEDNIEEANPLDK